jgi:hypothetical protein
MRLWQLRYVFCEGTIEVCDFSNIIKRYSSSKKVVSIYERLISFTVLEGLINILLS